MDEREVFVEVARAGSFTEAAKRLGISVSYCSRQVRGLEARLGVNLLARTTRQVHLTEAGARYAAQVGPLLQGLDEADAAARQLRLEPEGELRVAAPLSFGLLHVQPVVQAMLAEHDRLRIVASFDDRQVDPLHHDVTIRGGDLRDTGLFARRLCALDAWLVASPAYLDARGTPSHPSDLRDHVLLHYSGATTIPAWSFTRGDERVAVEVRPVFTADSGDALLAAGLAGLGVAQQPDFLVRDAIADGRLVRLLPEWAGFRSAFWALWPSRHPTAAVRAFVDRLAARLATSAGSGIETV